MAVEQGTEKYACCGHCVAVGGTKYCKTGHISVCFDNCEEGRVVL